MIDHSEGMAHRDRTHKRPLYVDVAILALLVALVVMVIAGNRKSNAPTIPNASQAGSAAAAQSAKAVASTSPTRETAATSSDLPLNKAKKEVPGTSLAAASRVASPYATPPLPFSEVNAAARAALVNIYCIANGNALRPISGSGVIIDPRGVILTNAHVAQYVLLSEVTQLNLSCAVRSGSPAAGSWIPEVLYIPPVWVHAHASELTEDHPVGTGEHDYALLYIAGARTTPLPPQFPYLPPDTREAIGFQGDSVLAASYPAEFLGPSAVNNLNAAASITNIRQLLTFSTSSVDAISVGGVIEAQSGSSGGAVANAWGRLIGIITTTSVGSTTSERDLRAITLSYIDRDLAEQTGMHLAQILERDPAASVLEFTRTQAQPLAQLLADHLQH